MDGGFDGASDDDDTSGNDILGGRGIPDEHKIVLWGQVREIEVRDGDVREVGMGDFARYKGLRRLAVTNSNVVKLVAGGVKAEVSMTRGEFVRRTIVY